MKTVAIIIARMGFSRLPGKVLSELGRWVVLDWVVTAAQVAPGVDEVWVATTTEKRDDVITKWCKNNGIPVFRGSEEDVLSRFYETALKAEADVVVRITGDCPFVDPEVIGQVVRLRQALNVDYASNIWPPTWPDGLDCEVFTWGALAQTYERATSKIDRECVTTYIVANQHEFTTANVTCPIPGIHKERWVLDTENDQKFMRLVAEHTGPGYSCLDILAVLDEHPEWRDINKHHPRNERYYAALANEPLEPRTYENSKRLLARAEKVIPLGAQTFSKSKIQYPENSPLFVTHGDGGYVWDVDGNRYVDLVGGLLPNILGYRDPDVNEAIGRQLDKGISFSLSTELEAELAETLCRLIPCAEMCRFGKNGTDATSAAVRLARAFTDHGRIISSGYHGWADWAVGHDPVRNEGVPAVGLYNTIPLKHGDISALKGLYGATDIAALIVEPETDPNFLHECRKFCDLSGALLIFDEIITGFRFDLGGAQKIWGVTPDLACFGKSMANGMPISALVGKREYMEHMVKTSYSGTFFGETLSLAAAIATIKKLEEEYVLDKIYERQLQLIDQINYVYPISRLVEISGVRLPRLNFASQEIKTLFIQEMAQNGVLIIASHNLCYAHGENELDRVVKAYEKTLQTIERANTKGIVGDLIGNKPVPAFANVRNYD